MADNQPILRINGGDVTVFCQTCMKQFSADGAVWLDGFELDEAETRAKADRGRTRWTMDELSKIPGPAKWRAQHYACRGEPKSIAYEIEVERLDTAAKLVDWTAHLMNKGWINDTDWSSVLRSAAGVHA